MCCLQGKIRGREFQLYVLTDFLETVIDSCNHVNVEHSANSTKARNFTFLYRQYIFLLKTKYLELMSQLKLIFQNSRAKQNKINGV